MCKEGWCVGLGQDRVAWGWGGAVWNTLKGGGTEKKGKGNKDFKKQGGGGGGKLGQGVTVLKRRGGLEPPYELCVSLLGMLEHRKMENLSSFL